MRVEEDKEGSGADDRSPGLTLGGRSVAPGERARLELPAARLPTGNLLGLPVEVIRGRRPGPRIWLSGAVHGDEVGGVEIIRRVTSRLDPERLAGAVVAIPIVNVFGFITESRYLPDRRDLNRSFPGSKSGSLAARLAHIFMEQVVAPCGYGIDFHSGSDDRMNLPQIRARLEDEEVLACARAFGAPITVDAPLRDRSLRKAASERGVRVLLYEGGEARRFDDRAIEAGTEGTLRVLRHLGMWEAGGEPLPRTRISRKTRWIRAPRSGIFHLEVELGEDVEAGGRLGIVRDSFGDERAPVTCRSGGTVIGATRNPLVNRGDGLVHLATVEDEGEGG